MREGVALRFDKLELPSSKDALCNVWLRLIQWFLKRSRKYKKVNRQKDG